MSATVDEAMLARFVYHEARLVDEKRFDEWFELFTDDARYWMPLTRGQPDADNHTSLLYEDKLLLRIRIERLKSSRSFSQHPPSFCQHVLQAPQLEGAGTDGRSWVMRTPFTYVESQLDSQLLLAGTGWLHVVELAGSLRIRLKKVELVNCDAALPSIQLFP
jgi:3-phenylpropionate/cinnamic acid dioxygenase small subunit